MHWGLSPAEFWTLHPKELEWQIDARLEKRRTESVGGQLSEQEATEMKEELRRARVAAGYPAD